MAPYGYNDKKRIKAQTLDFTLFCCLASVGMKKGGMELGVNFSGYALDLRKITKMAEEVIWGSPIFKKPIVLS